MKQYLVFIVTITLISSTQCGLIDGLFGAVKDTAHAIKEDVGGVVRYGKNVVFGENKPANTNQDPNVPVTEKDIAHVGLFDKVSIRIHSIAAGVREHVRSVFAIVDGDQKEKGLIGRMFDRVKNHAIKFKTFLIGDISGQNNNGQSEQPNPGRYPAHLTDKLKKYVFKNSSTPNQGVRKTLHSLREAVEAIKKNMTMHKQKEGENYGEGLIDVRIGETDSDYSNQYNDIDRGVHAGYDNVEDQVLGIGRKVNSSFNDFKQGSNSFIEDQRNNLGNNYNKLSYNGNNISNDVATSLNKIETRFGSDAGDITNHLTNAYDAVNKSGGQ